MYIQRIKVSFIGDEPQKDIVDVADDYLAALRMNGQVCGEEWPIYSERGFVIAIALSPEEDSLKPENNGEYVKKSIREAEELGISISSELIGQDCSSSEPCICNESSGYVLFTTYVSIESPVRCIDCFLPVPLYTFPVFQNGDYYEIICWQSNYKNCDHLLMNCSVLERASTRQISDPRSSLSKAGLEICRLLTHLSGKPFYYYLYRGSGRSVASEKERRCPSCGQPWYLKTPLHSLFHYKCDHCRLMSNFAWNLSHRFKKTDKKKYLTI
ncbi:Zn-ribbon-containing protein [Myxococcota bacterium]|nr:Zn-ribbon-containing protein [Myxococcota bacterium]